MGAAVDLGQIDLNLLYTFRMVVDLGGVGAAARRLGRTQPAVSARLRQLERDLGVPLFERAGRGLQLSRAGRAIEADVRAVLRSVHGVIERAQSADDEPVGTLRIGALPTVSAYVLGWCVRDYLQDYPAASVEIETGLTTPQIERLVDGHLDLVVAVGPPPRGELELRTVGRVRPVLAFSRAIRPRPRAPMSARLLRSLPLLGYGDVGDFFFDEVWAFLARHGLDRDIRLRVPNIQTLEQMVLLGAGVSILPSYTVKARGLATMPVSGLSFTHPMWAAYRPSSRHLPLVARFLDRLPAS